MTKLPVFFFAKWLLFKVTFPQDITGQTVSSFYCTRRMSWTKTLKQLVAKGNNSFSTRDTPGNPQTQEPHATLINNHHYLVWWNNHMFCGCKTHSLSLMSMTGLGFLFRCASRHPEVPEVIHVGYHFFSRAHGSLAGTNKMFYKNKKKKICTKFIELNSFSENNSFVLRMHLSKKQCTTSILLFIKNVQLSSIT